MLDDGALGRAGAAAGVDDVGGGGRGRRGRRVPRRGRELREGVLVEGERRGEELGEALLGGARGDGGGGFAFGDDGLEALGWVGRVEEDECAAGFEDGDDGDDCGEGQGEDWDGLWEYLPVHIDFSKHSGTMTSGPTPSVTSLAATRREVSSRAR